LYSCYSFTTSALDGVSGQRHAPAAIYPSLPIGQVAGWAPEPIWTQKLEEDPLPVLGIEHGLPGRPFRCQTVYLLKYSDSLGILYWKYLIIQSNQQLMNLEPNILCDKFHSKMFVFMSLDLIIPILG
jgi:hypothetical protein